MEAGPNTKTAAQATDLYDACDELADQFDREKILRDIDERLQIRLIPKQLLVFLQITTTDPSFSDLNIQ